MKAKELIKILEQHPERVIVLSKDEEGNDFSYLEDVFIGAYADGEIGIEKMTPELKREGYDYEDVMQGGVAAIVLFP